MKKHLFSFLLIGLIAFNGFAQTFNQVKLDSLFDSLEKNDKFMGSIAISQNGNEIYARAIGYADIESSKKADTNTKYRIGSISKMFTASLIFKAIEEDKLKLSDPLSNFYPEIESANEITIKELLGHRSGIFNFTNSPSYLEYNTTSKTKKELIQIIKDVPNVFKPNEKTEYSNSNFVLLTFILEDVFKKSYTQLVKEKITEPLGLKSTYVGGNIQLENNESNSYRFAETWTVQDETDMSIPLGAGAIVSIPSDLNTFVIALFNGKVISTTSLDQMTNIQDGLGLGIMQFPFNDKMGYGHGGGIDGFSSFLGYLKDDKIAVGLTSNGTIYDNNQILISAVSAVLDIPFKIPTFEEFDVDPAVLETYIGVYASTQIPLKITISKKDDALIAQATGQGSFPLTASANNIFRFEPAGVVLEFDSEKSEMTLKQGGGEFLFTKE